MKLTREELRQIIKEQLEEAFGGYRYGQGGAEKHHYSRAKEISAGLGEKEPLKIKISPKQTKIGKELGRKLIDIGSKNPSLGNSIALGNLLFMRNPEYKKPFKRLENPINLEKLLSDIKAAGLLSDEEINAVREDFNSIQ